MLFELILGSLSLLPMQDASRLPQQHYVKGSSGRQLAVGVVVEAVTGQPIGGAKVVLAGSSPMYRGTPKVTLSDAEGKFHFELDEPGTFIANAEVDGYTTVDAIPRQTAFRYADGQAPSLLRIELARVCQLTGRLIDQNTKQPLPGVILVPMLTFHTRGRRTLLPMDAKATTTDDKGRFRIEGLPGGQYFIEAGPSLGETIHEHRGSEPKTLEDRPQLLRRELWPPASDLETAYGIVLEPGSVRDIGDISLAPGHVLRIQGRILFDGCEAGMKVKVVVERQYGRLRMNAAMADLRCNSQYTVDNLAPGTYAIEAWLTGRKKSDRAFCREEVVVEKKDATRDLMLQAPIIAEGRLRVPDGVDVQAIKDVRIELGSIEAANFVDNQPMALDKDGLFTAFLRPGLLHELKVRGLPESLVVRKVQLNGEPIQRSAFTAKAGALKQELDIEISDRPSSISGSVSENKVRAAAAIVILVEWPASNSEYPNHRMVRTDTEGRFVINSMHPGEFRVFAIPEREGRMIEYSNTLKYLASNGVKVKVEEGSRSAVELEVTHPPTRLE
jgi:hypothetical protein